MRAIGESPTATTDASGNFNVVTGTTMVTATCTADQSISTWRVDANVFTWVVFNCQ